MHDLWNEYHQQVIPYGDDITYQLGADWLKDCALVEDWGCGPGWAKHFFRPEQYRGLDGSPSPNVDQIVDLRTYRSMTPGIFMRHVLEHNFEWELVLDNALDSFTERMALILFTPMVEVTHQIVWNPGYEVPDISFRPLDLESRFPTGVDFSVEDHRTGTQYGQERIYYLSRRR